MRHIYCISGLGADQQIFQKLKIDDAVLHPIKWVMPDADDDMESFAGKLSRQIKHERIILLGVSYGGMLATVMSQQLQSGAQTVNGKPVLVEKTIIISSCKQRAELPAFLRLAGRLRLHRAVPYKAVMHFQQLNRFVFDMKSKEEELYLKRMMLRAQNFRFVERSVNIILRWKSGSPQVPVLHIHGTSDRLLTPRHIKADYWIKGGGHFMVYNRATEISRIINQILAG